MKFKYLLPLLLTSLFTGCLSEEEILQSVLGDPVAVADGIYQTDCLVENAASSRIYLEISEGATQRTVQTELYAGDETCTTLTDDGTADAQTTNIELANFGFGNGISFFKEKDPELGELQVPYHVDGDDLYLGASEEAIEGSEPADIFSEFINDPKNTAGFKFTLQPL